MDDVFRVFHKYVTKLFNPESSISVVVCAPSRFEVCIFVVFDSNCLRTINVNLFFKDDIATYRSLKYDVHKCTLDDIFKNASEKTDFLSAVSGLKN